MTNDLRQAVYDKLVAVGQDVYYETAPDHAKLPYIVYSFPSELISYQKRIVKLLQIDLYDVEREGYNVKEKIELTADNVDAVIDYVPLAYGSVIGWCRRLNRIGVPFPEGTNLMQRELTYELKTYKE